MAHYNTFVFFYMGGELKRSILLFQKCLFCKTEPVFCCNSAVDVNPPCTPVAVMLPSPRHRLYDDLRRHPSATNFSKTKTLSVLTTTLQLTGYRKEPINCSDGEHAGKLTPGVQAARSSESQCGWPKSALLFHSYL